MEIERARRGITDYPMDSSQVASAVLITDGSTTTVPVDVTTRQLISPMAATNGGVRYATTVVASLDASKSDSNTATQDYVTATITIYWTDNFGTSNGFEGVSGSWVVSENPVTHTRATLSNRLVTIRGHGISASDYGQPYQYQPISNSFSLGDSAYEDGWWAYVAESSVRINSSSTLRVSVSSGQISIG